LGAIDINEALESYIQLLQENKNFNSRIQLVDYVHETRGYQELKINDCIAEEEMSCSEDG
jgi:hypothetical protein